MDEVNQIPSATKFRGREFRHMLLKMTILETESKVINPLFI